MDFFIKITAAIINGDLTYVEHLKKIVQQAHDLAIGKIITSQLDDAYREIAIYLVHLDRDYFQQKQVLDLKPKSIKYMRNLVLPNTTKNRKQINKTRKLNSNSGCGCY